MNPDLSVSNNIRIGADRMRVWSALTDPQAIKQYLYGADTVTDWKAGSPVVFQGEVQGQKWRDKGVVLEVREGELLRYSYWSGFCGLEDAPGNYSIVTYALESRNDGTLLTITQQGYPNEQSQQSSGANWTGILQKIREIAEG